MRLANAAAVCGLASLPPCPFPRTRSGLAGYIAQHGIEVFRRLPVDMPLRLTRNVRFIRRSRSPEYTTLLLFENEILHIGDQHVLFRAYAQDRRTASVYLNLCGIHVYLRRGGLFTQCNMRVPEFIWLHSPTNGTTVINQWTTAREVVSA